jgi:hypothetical protein
VLCILEGMELCKVSSSSYAIKNRFDLLPQPILIDTPVPEYDIVWGRADKEEIDALGIVMDHLAVDVIKSSLKDELVIGEEVSFGQVSCDNPLLTYHFLQIHRKQYHAFAKSAMERTLLQLPPTSVLEQLRTKYPAHFEVTKRMAHVYKDVFKSSAVRYNFFFDLYSAAKQDISLSYKLYSRTTLCTSCTVPGALAHFVNRLLMCSRKT